MFRHKRGLFPTRSEKILKIADNKFMDGTLGQTSKGPTVRVGKPTHTHDPILTGKLESKSTKMTETKSKRFKPIIKRLKKSGKVRIKPATINGKKGRMDFEHPKVVLFLGKPNRGKTYAMKHLVLDQTLVDDGFKFGMVFTGSDFNDDYKWMPESYIVNGWNLSAFILWIEYLKQMRKKHDKPVKNFLVFDDLVGRIPLSCSEWNNFICNHRHYGTSVFISCQYLTRGTSPTFRECVNYAILFNTKTLLTLKILYEVFGQLFPTQREFINFFMSNTTEKYTAILYDQDQDDISLNYLKYKAPAKVPELILDFNP